MKKQIAYPDLITKVFATCIDVLFLAIIVSIFDVYLRKTTCIWALSDIIKESGIATDNIVELEKFFSSYQQQADDVQV